MADEPAPYGVQLRTALRRRGWSIRDLERRLRDADSKSYSYEHIRKVTSGLPVMSEGFNEIVCGLLGLDPAAMWQVALRAKAVSGTRSAIIAGSIAASAPTADLRAMWNELTAADHAKVARYIEGLVEQRRAENMATTATDPQEIAAQIRRLTDRFMQVMAVKPT